MPVLYLSYDGLLEQLGQSQVFQYLRGLSLEHPIILLTYEKASDWNDEARRLGAQQRVREAGFKWVPLTYHRRPAIIAKVFDLWVGFVVAAYLSIRYRVRLVHARSYMVTLIALGLRAVFGIPYIFDMRGFWFDARAEMGFWDKGAPLFRAAKWLEAKFILNAAAVVALNSRAVDAMRGWPQLAGRNVRYHVVTTCTNLNLFQPRTYPEKTGDEYLVGYVGNAGPAHLFDQVLDCFREIRRVRTNARLRIVNRRDHAVIRESLRQHAIPSDIVELESCEHQDVPGRMAEMDVGIFFARPYPSRIGDVPTRMGEFLACGIPCLSNAGIGGVVEVLEGEQVGVVIRNFGQAQIKDAVAELLKLSESTSIRERCVIVAQKRFSLEDGVIEYSRLYKDLLG